MRRGRGGGAGSRRGASGARSAGGFGLSVRLSRASLLSLEKPETFKSCQTQCAGWEGRGRSLLAQFVSSALVFIRPLQEPEEVGAAEMREFTPDNSQ